MAVKIYEDERDIFERDIVLTLTGDTSKMKLGAVNKDGHWLGVLLTFNAIKQVVVKHGYCKEALEHHLISTSALSWDNDGALDIIQGED